MKNIYKLTDFIKKTYGVDSIKLETNTPNNRSDIIYVNKTKLTNITDENFKKFINTRTTSDYIKINEFVTFLESTNNNSTKGKYHEFMDMIHALYSVEIMNDLPNYKNLDKDIREKIIPKRIEYMICWWILHKLRTDEFISKYVKITYPVFQKLINDIEHRYYDVVFDKLDIIIEIQENNSQHVDNHNDILKEALVKIKNKRILYFKVKEYQEFNYSYLNKFWNILRETIIESLLANYENVRPIYCDYVFMKEIKVLYEKTKEYTYECILATPDKSFLKQLFEWREDALENNNTYNIPLERVFKKLQSTNEDKLEEIIINKFIYRKDEEDVIYIDWKSIVRLVIIYAETNFIEDKDQILIYLTNVENIYQKICNKITNHYKECMKTTDEMYNMYEKHIVTKLTDKYENDLQKYKSKVKIYEEQIKLIANKFTQGRKYEYKLLPLLTTKIKTEAVCANIYDNLRELNKLYECMTLKINAFITFQNINDKPIIKELDNFPIVYSDNTDNTMDYETFVAVCKLYNIPDTAIKQIYTNLLPYGSNGKPKIIPNVRLLN